MTMNLEEARRVHVLYTPDVETEGDTTLRLFPSPHERASDEVAELWDALTYALDRGDRLERAIKAARSAYNELSSLNRDKFGVEEMTAWRILNDIFFKDLFGIAALREEER